MNLLGFSSIVGEDSYPANRGIAAAGDYWLTYSSGTLSAWDYSGNRVDQTTLVGAGTSFDADFSLSYANSKVFIVDQAGGSWRGYDIGLLNESKAIPEPTSLIGFLGLGAFGITSLRKRK
ncbi:PEP-CTERM sorting domain-containing protein [Nostoc sp. LEGE 12450]|uniref:PEP-CTERM sorting domain-containing protein n=1 Tax=Nostoc sp. LEGE 12450 TaxID=1828643 RepID=UPI001881AF07|nr:PEP-CTERM sorting domain-containing protein [Nostoc sp. LEGE 12450]MBE8990805.1 PEP-CTERM sorting domain-containing protein [Nostoc sp. LEGE 12450]